MIKPSTDNSNICIHRNLKTSAETLYKEPDIKLSTDNETFSAMLEAERIAKDHDIKGYHDVDDFFANLDA